MNNFELALVHVLKSEGGYSDHPSDPGRQTNKGITKATLERFRGCIVSADDIKNLTHAEAAEIYLKLYWLPHKLDRIQNKNVAIVLFDQIVNRRAKEVIRGVQKSIVEMMGSILEVDGVMGPATIEVINELKPEWLIASIVIDAQKAYLGIVDRAPGQAVFLKGWLARTWRLLELV